MILVTTHRGAGIDAYAAVGAASLLHPGAAISFPGTKSPALRAFLDAMPSLALPEIDEAKVAELKTRIDSGEYNPSSSSIASKVLGTDSE